jgi:hypothetical protein
MHLIKEPPMKVDLQAFQVAPVTTVVLSISWVLLVLGGVLRSTLVLTPGTWPWTTSMAVFSGATPIRETGCQFVA